MNCKTNKLRDAIAFALVAVAGGAISSAYAQDASDSNKTTDLDRVQVTGSRIRGVDIETAQPVATITAQDIQKSGLISVGDILSNMPSAGAQNYSKAAVLTSGSDIGGQFVNIRNLGENRALVLVNGKRWETSTNGLTDLSTIPASMIDHIDILKDGASAIYGSDAISGVINIILKDHMDGAQASVYYGVNDRGDGGNTQYSLSFGTSTDRSSILIGADYNKTDPVWARSREATAYTYGPNHALSGLSGTGPWGYFRRLDANGAATGSRYTINNTLGDAATFYGDGAAAGPTNDPSNYHIFGSYYSDYYNPTYQMSLAGSNEDKSFFTTGSYNITDSLQFKATFMYNERENIRQVAGYPTTSLSQPLYPVYIDKDSYYNPYPGEDLYFARRVIELPRVSDNTVKVLHFDGGLYGSFNLGSHTWDWDVGLNYNKFDSQAVNTGNLNLYNLKQALGPSFLNSNGVVQCGTAASPISLTQCVPFDILGGPSNSTPQALAYINDVGPTYQQVVSKEIAGNINGTLFSWWAGDVNLALGYEHHEVSGYEHVDELVKSALTTDLAAGDTNSSYSTNEYYIELGVPLLKDLPGAKLLMIDAAARYSDYSNFGNNTKPKFSLSWRPIDDLLVRGTIAKGFRAPTIADIAGGGSQSFDGYTDPCDTRFGLAATNPAVAARCQAEGLSSTFRQITTAGTPITAPNTQGITPFNAGVGNSTLTPEQSKTSTLGLVYSPSYVPGLTVSVDWYKIKITNIITAISANYVLDQCYQQQVQFYCDSFTRNAETSQVEGLNRGNTNLGWTSTEGYDIGVNYRLPETSWGTFNAHLDMTYLVNYLTQSQPGAQVLNSVGYWSYPRVRGNISLDWQRGDWGASYKIRYYGAFRDDCWENDAGGVIECNQPNYESPNWGAIGANRKGNSTYHDINISYNTPWNGQIMIGVNNVWDHKRPITYDVGNSSSSDYDPALDTDRYIYMRYTQKF